MMEVSYGTEEREMSELMQEEYWKEDLAQVLSGVLEDGITFENQMNEFDKEVEEFISTWQGQGLDSLVSALYGAGLDGGDIFDILTQYAGAMAAYMQLTEKWEEDSAESAGGIGGE